MDSVPLVSVVIPVFNDELGVKRCLDAIAKQTYPMDAVEVVVVDNGSRPPLLVDGMRPYRFKLIRCTTPGSYAARNAGGKAATGNVLAFIDADCWPDPRWLACGVNSLRDSDGTSIVGGEVIIAKPERPTSVALYQLATGFGQQANIRDKGFAATANLFCTRSQFQKVGPFDERLLSGGDREWCWRATRCGIDVKYEPTAMIRTWPRTSLRGASRQARRVVAGRKMLRELGLAHIGRAAVTKNRSATQAARWILTETNLSWRDRLRVLFAATVIRGASAMESFRLALGGIAERR